MHEQMPLALGERHGFLLDNFKGEKNQALVSMLRQCSAELLGKGLFLWGEQGIGLSHLLQSLCYEFVIKGKKAFFWQAGMPIPDFDFLSDNWDLYVFDDLDLFVGNKQAELLVYNAYNSMKEGALLLVGSHQPCQNISCALPDLHSRLQSLVSQQVFPLAEEELRCLIKQTASERGHQLSDKVITYMLRHFNRSTKSQLGLLDELDRKSWIDKKPITLPSLKAQHR